MRCPITPVISRARDVLVAGVGNIFCTDDGFGPAVITRLLASIPAPRQGVRIADYGIRGVHLAYDLLDPPDVLILVDAVPDRGEPGRVRVLRIEAGDVPGTGSGSGIRSGSGIGSGQLDTHGMDPATVLANLASLGGHLPATTLLVGCEAAVTGEGLGLTPPVEAAVEVAADVVLGLLQLHAAGSGLTEVI